MTEKTLKERSGNKCELCLSTDNLAIYVVTPKTEESSDTAAYLCAICSAQADDADKMDADHWRCLGDSMWSQEAPVQVLAHRMLTRLSSEPWAKSYLDMLFLEDDNLSWSNESNGKTEDEFTVIHKDCNGAILAAGDTVTLIKDLNVKGGGFTAKRGTAVRNISLVSDNAGQIEGRVSSQQIIILTEFVKKS